MHLRDKHGRTLCAAQTRPHVRLVSMATLKVANEQSGEGKAEPTMKSQGSVAVSTTGAAKVA